MKNSKYKYGEQVNQTEFLKNYSVGRISEKEKLELAEQIDKKISRYKLSSDLIKHLIALKRYLFDSEVKWYRKSVVVAALIYFLTPVDAIPDFAPFFGLLDDIGVIAFTIKFLGKEIEKYY